MDKRHGHDPERLKQKHGAALSAAQKLQHLEKEILRVPMPPTNAADAKKMDDLLAQAQDFHDVLRTHISEVRAELKPLLG